MIEEDPIKVLIKIAKILDELKIDYYVTGGFAVSIWDSRVLRLILM